MFKLAALLFFSSFVHSVANAEWTKDFTEAQVDGDEPGWQRLRGRSSMPELSSTPVFKPKSKEMLLPTTSIKHRVLQELMLVDPEENLGECEGDCDKDTDCQPGLICFQRDGTESVPDCIGSGVSGRDYCYLPPEGTLVLFGKNEDDNPSAYPLDKCQGDCDNDDECMDNLICFQRGGTEAVPGCTGEGQTKKDYCYDPNPTATDSPTIALTSSPTSSPSQQASSAPSPQLASSAPSPQLASSAPSPNPTALPTLVSSSVPSLLSSQAPSVSNGIPTASPSEVPSSSPTKTFVPSSNPTLAASEFPSAALSSSPSSQASQAPSDAPSPPSPSPSLLPSPIPSVLASIELTLGDESQLLGQCFGDCDNDGDCEPGLNCFQRDGFEAVPGCIGSGESRKDYCYLPPEGTLVRVDQADDPSVFPLARCEGDCDNDNDCSGRLLCFQRSGTEPVPGCIGEGQNRKDYCYDPDPGPTASPTIAPTFQPVPTASPTLPPTFPPVPPGTVTYIPGQADSLQSGLRLSVGLVARIIAIKDDPVPLENGGFSTEDFHTAPDGAAVFQIPETGGWWYVSNAESTSRGGVGAILFDSDGRVIDYQLLLSGTRRNCGGGKTFWETWMSCEEVDDGQIWEVDPFTGVSRQTVMGGAGMRYESAAYDNRNTSNPTFYITVDGSNGPLVRFTPNPQTVQDALITGDYSEVLHTASGSKIDYIFLTFDTETTGTYVWTDDLALAQQNARDFYPSCEGIDIKDGLVYVTCKSRRQLFILDLDAKTFEESSTTSGAFNGQPDQVGRIVGDDTLYFCEDSSEKCGIHGRDSTGQYFTVFQEESPNFDGETTGIAFSPDNRIMYVSFQKPGFIFEIRRLDGLPFNGQPLDLKYHGDATNPSPFIP